MITKVKGTTTISDVKRTLQHRITLLEGIARGEKAIEEGRSFTHKQAKQQMSRWLNSTQRS